MMNTGQMSSSQNAGTRIRLRHVLCPVDLSANSQHALEHARAFARWFGADVTVLEVVWAGLPPIAFPGAISGGPSMPVLTPEERSDFLTELTAFAATPTRGTS